MRTLYYYLLFFLYPGRTVGENPCHYLDVFGSCSITNKHGYKKKEGAQVEEEVRRVNEEAEKANQKAQERMKKAYDKREQVDEEKLVKIGEWVMVKLVEERVGGALEPRNEGPYKVVAVDENCNCELEGMGKGLRKTYPMDVLSVFHGAPQ